VADFCNQCAKDHYFEPGDLAGLGPLKEREAWQVICEGCGPTMVNNEGDCVSHYCLKKHGKKIE